MTLVHLWLWSIWDSYAFVIVIPKQSSRLLTQRLLKKRLFIPKPVHMLSAHARAHVWLCVHERCHVYMCTCAYAYAYMCIHERCHVNTKACVNGIWGWWWNSILAIWLPSVVYLYNQENIYFIACRCIMYILISENWNGMGYLWIYDWYVFPVKEQIHGSAKYS